MFDGQSFAFLQMQKKRAKTMSMDKEIYESDALTMWSLSCLPDMLEQLVISDEFIFDPRIYSPCCMTSRV